MTSITRSSHTISVPLSVYFMLMTSQSMTTITRFSHTISVPLSVSSCWWRHNRWRPLHDLHTHIYLCASHCSLYADDVTIDDDHYMIFTFHICASLCLLHADDVTIDNNHYMIFTYHICTSLSVYFKLMTSQSGVQCITMGPTYINAYIYIYAPISRCVHTPTYMHIYASIVICIHAYAYVRLSPAETDRRSMYLR